MLRGLICEPACPSKPAAVALVEVHLRQAFSGHGLQIHGPNWRLQLDPPLLLGRLPLRPALTPARRLSPAARRQRSVLSGRCPRPAGPKDRWPPRLPAGRRHFSARSRCLHGRSRGPVLHVARAGAASQRPLATAWPAFVGFIVLELVGHSADVVWLEPFVIQGLFGFVFPLLLPDIRILPVDVVLAFVTSGNGN